MAKIRGHVFTSYREPLEGVLLTFVGDQSKDRDETESEEDGGFKTKMLKPGDYRWTAEKEGFVPESGRIANLKAGMGVVDLDAPILLEQVGLITGRVTNKQSQPVPGAQVIAIRSDDKVSSEDTTNDDGLYFIVNLAPGVYEVSVVPLAGFQEPPPLHVSLKAGSQNSDNNFQMIAVAAPTGPTGPITGPPPPVTGPTGPTLVVTGPSSPVTGPTGAVTLPTGPTLPVTGPTGPSTLPSGPTLLPSGPTAPITIPTAPTVTVTGPIVPTVAASPTQVPAPTGPAVFPPAGTSQEVRDFLSRLGGAALSIEAEISEAEALEAITLFSIVNVLLAGMAPRKVGNEQKTDVLGVLTLYYGLQDKSLTNRIVLNSQELWTGSLNGSTVEDELKSLRDNLDVLGQDVVFLSREAKRQFNLGINNDVVGNVEFPRLFKRYVDIANDARLTLNLRDEDKPNSFTSKEKIGEAYELLSELKGVILQIVRSLSKYGTVATSRANKDWAKFGTRAFRVLEVVGAKRFTEDIDDRRILTVLADLTDKNLETVISPYFALARNGGALLALAFEAYLAAKDRKELDKFERESLLRLFQAEGSADNFLTTRMRNHALVVKRYQLGNWN